MSATNGYSRPVIGIKRDTFSVSTARQTLVQSLDRLVHMAGASLLITVFLWHFSDEAWHLPSAKTWGWFYKFLTFWSLTLQSIQYALAAFESLTREKSKAAWVTPLVDDLSCVAFTSACAVTSLFYGLQFVTRGGLDPIVKPPDWVGYSVHVYNSVLALLDITLAARRTFSRRAQRICVGYVMAYAMWIWVVKMMVGEFPYPFMNKIPQPGGFIVVAAVSFVMLSLIFVLGSYWSRFATRMLGKAVVVHKSTNSKKAA